jgi:hypothetical protein
MSDVVTINLENPDIILMARPESPAMVHGQVARDVDPRLDPLWEHEKRPKGTAWVERGPDGDIAVAQITEPIEIELRVHIDLPPEKAEGMVRRPAAMVMIYADEESRMAGLNDFRTGGVRGLWAELGIVLPHATTDPLRA